MADYVITRLGPAATFGSLAYKRRVALATAVLPQKKPLVASIVGRVIDKENTPIAGRVFCYERATGVLVDSTYSNANGDYAFYNLNDKKAYFVTAIDEDERTSQENAVTQDLISPT